MTSRAPDTRFEHEIESRLASSRWSAMMASTVIARLGAERRRRLINTVSYLFPVAAAALLLMAITFQSLLVTPEANVAGESADTGSSIVFLETSGLLSDEVDQIIRHY